MKSVGDATRDQDATLEQIAANLGQGLLFVDAQGEVLWMDEQTRRQIDGGLRKLNLPLRRSEARASIDCFLTTAEVELNGESRELCVLQSTSAQDASERDIRGIMSAIEEVLSEPTWFTRPLLEKLKARLQAAPLAVADSELERLTAREREILALVCEGRTDPEMGRILGLSQNTVRNHLASVFRKIGVNRRSAAVIWARERAITKHDALAIAELRRSRRRVPS